MATPARCLANAENAKLSTGPKTEQGKATAAKNSVGHGLFAAFESLAPADKDRIGQFVIELHDGLPEQSPAYEDVIGQYAIAKWRSELCCRLQSAFFASATADFDWLPTRANQWIARAGIFLLSAVSSGSPG